jgi:hypothetical protein
MTRWYGYLNKRRAEDKMLDKIDRTFSATGRDGRTKDERPVLVIGDWARTERRMLKGWAPVRNVGMTRLLSRHFHLFLIREGKVWHNYGLRLCGREASKQTQHHQENLLYTFFLADIHHPLPHLQAMREGVCDTTRKGNKTSAQCAYPRYGWFRKHMKIDDFAI